MSNTTAVKTFTFPVTNQNVRITDPNGKPWFMLSDVCKILGISNTTVAVRPLAEDEWVRLNLNQRGLGSVLMINKQGLHRLLMRSDKPIARQFQDWLLYTVLPSFEENGGYIMGQEKLVTGEMSDLEFLAKAQAVAMRVLEQMTAERDALLAENQILAPKAKLYDQYMDVDGTLNLTSAAKVLGFTSGRALGMYLRETLGWLFKDTKQVIPKAHVIEKGFMTTKAWSMIDRQKSGVQGRITAKGMD